MTSLDWLQVGLNPLTIPLTISVFIGSIMGDETSILVWSFVPPIAFCAIAGGGLVRMGSRRDSAERLRDREAVAAVASILATHRCCRGPTLLVWTDISRTNNLGWRWRYTV